MTNNKQTLALFLISFILSACTQISDDPKTVAAKYWQNMQNGNTVEAEKLVSKDSRHALQEHRKRLDSSTTINSGKATTIVTTTITTIDPDSNYRDSQTFNTVLVLQNGQWKVDASQSKIPAAPGEKEKQMKQLADELSESMQENIDSMDDTINQGMQMLNKALHEGSEEMGDSLLQLMNELNTTMKQSIDKMKQRREQKQEKPQQANPQKAQPDPQQGEGMI